MTDGAQAGRMDWRLRQPGRDDLPALLALGRQTFSETFGHLYSAADLSAFLNSSFGEEGMASHFTDPAYRFRVADIGEPETPELVGYAKMGPPSLPVPQDGRSRTELRQLYVRGPWQGSGMAAALMEWALETARAGDHDDVYLSVYADNPRAQRFYTRYGFEEVGKMIFMVGTHEDDERIWRLNLR